MHARMHAFVYMLTSAHAHIYSHIYLHYIYIHYMVGFFVEMPEATLMHEIEII